jgi:hypothetical protein
LDFFEDEAAPLHVFDRPAEEASLRAPRKGKIGAALPEFQSPIPDDISEGYIFQVLKSALRYMAVLQQFSLLIKSG